MSSEYFIAGDWGTSNLRLYLCEYNVQQSKTTVIAEKSGRGVAVIAKQDQANFEAAFFSLTQEWFDQYTIRSTLLSGMIGSNIGWKLAPYAGCPGTTLSMSQNCLQFTSRDHPIFIVSGLKCTNPLGEFDVMRGEELQLLGWLLLNPHSHDPRLIVLPGTHNKWVLVQGRQITTFMTTFTGELFALLSEHSVLIQAANPHTEDHWQSFESALDLSLNNTRHELIQTLFSTRSRQISGQLKPQHARDYLSGLILGHEVRGAIEQFAAYFEGICSVPIVLIGDAALCARYTRVLQRFAQVEATHYPSTDIAISGFQAVYQAPLNS